MSGDKKPDHYQAERQDATQQNTGVDDAVNKAVNISPGMLSSPGGFGNTSFEGYELNAMIDIVEGASPETLESAATALVDARDAINDAADELSRNLGNVDWEGEAHTAFYTWGMNLTTTALELASYTDDVGTQVLAASSGLASVRKSMPPRDSRIVPKKVEDIPTPQQVEGNAEYTAAVKAEKDRQEAINQMYRLASFYTVSSGMMEMAKEPVFPEMPDVGVPAPPPEDGLNVGEPIAGSRGTAINSGSTSHHVMNSTATRPGTHDLPASHTSPDETVGLPERHVGTEIDSVGTLPPQDTTRPATVAPPSTTVPNATPGGPPSSFAPVGVPPTFRGAAGRVSPITGASANRFSASQGRVAGTPGGTAAGRTGIGPVGPTGRADAAGKTGGRTAGPMERGVVGGAPKPAGQPMGRTASGPRGPVTGAGAMNPGRPGGAGRFGAGRVGNGVVGGRPVTAGPAGSKTSKLSRGTVVGSEGTLTPRDAGERPGQRGVVGAPRSTAGPAAGQAARRSGGSPGGVVGTPQGRVSGGRNGGNPSSGPGAGRGSARKQGSGETRSRRDERRDDASSTD
ncbi:WXG100 family type VII secretion target [Streptomyces sp. P3]|uniref:WXG100 family type VII secretion target n=1 Tax=Streptomyces sp. P3 TaxID=2135430 RepID=UPI00131F0366|nr:WXG100 family type VII secretion target [Streptomyces sp. P3]